MVTSTALDDGMWREAADQGWLGPHLPEAVGGLGLGLVDLAILSEELGHACFPGPFAATQFAATLVAEACEPSRAAELLAPVLSGESRATVAIDATRALPGRGDMFDLAAESSRGAVYLSGQVAYVLDAAAAETLIAPARQGDQIILAAVPRGLPGVSVAPMADLDATRKWTRVTFDGARVETSAVLATSAAASQALDRAIGVATLVTVADMLGATQWMLEASVEYAKTRQQFGRAIGVFQAVQHHCADMLLWTESTRSAVYYAAWAMGQGEEDAARALSMAKAYGSDAARDVANRASQVHGGIGFTWEHDLQLYYKRCKASESLFGASTEHRERVAETVLA